LINLRVKGVIKNILEGYGGNNYKNSYVVFNYTLTDDQAGVEQF